MNKTIEKILEYAGVAFLGIIVGILLATVFSTAGIGGVYSNVQKDFSEGISVDGTVVIDGSGNIDAPITSTTGTFSSTLEVTGAATLSSTLGVAGITSLTEALNVTEVTGTSTVAVQATAASTGGRIILEDSDGAGCSEIYILNGTVISATITCP